MSQAHARSAPSTSLAFATRLRDTPEFTLRRARDREDWRLVRLLRYEALHGRGEIGERPERSYADAHDAAFNAATFVLESCSRVLGTTRSSVRSALRRWPLPADEAFASEIESALGRDSTIVEASLTATDPQALEPKIALIHLFKAHMLHCAAENADWLITAVRDTQIGFFRRMFSMEILSGAERYPGLATPRVLMGLAFREQAALLGKRIPVLSTTAAEERAFAAAGARE